MNLRPSSAQRLYNPDVMFKIKPKVLLSNGKSSNEKCRFLCMKQHAVSGVAHLAQRLTLEGYAHSS